MYSSRDLDTVLRRQYKHLVRETAGGKIPAVVGTMALRHFKRAMQDEGFRDRRLVKWKEVNRRKKGHPQFKPKQQQKILVGKGSGGIMNTLRNTRRTWEEVVIASQGKPYAKYHNEGGGRLPRRQFLGNSHTLERAVEKRVMSMIDKALST